MGHRLIVVLICIMIFDHGLIVVFDMHNDFIDHGLIVDFGMHSDHIDHRLFSRF